jgi:hypothetical protein
MPGTFLVQKQEAEALNSGICFLVLKGLPELNAELWKYKIIGEMKTVACIKIKGKVKLSHNRL